MAFTAKQKKDYMQMVTAMAHHWQEILGLQNYELTFVGDDEMYHTQMSVGWTPGYRRITFSVNTNPEWPEVNLRPEVVEHAVVHELVHLLLGPMQDLAYQEFDGEGLLFHKFRTANEQSVDTVTAVILRLGERYSVAKRAGRRAIAGGRNTRVRSR